MSDLEEKVEAPVKIKSPHCTCPQSSNSLFADLFRGGLTGRGAGPSRVADGVRGASDAYPFPQKKRLHKRRLRPSHPPGLPLCSLVEVRPRRSDGKRTVRPRRSRRQAATFPAPCRPASATRAFFCVQPACPGPTRPAATRPGRWPAAAGGWQRQRPSEPSHGVLLTPPAPAFPSRCPPVVVCHRFRWDPSHRSSAPPPSAWADTTVRRLRLSQRWRRLLPSRRTN